MSDDIIHVNFSPDEKPRRRRGLLAVAGLVLFALLFFVFFRYILTLALLLGLAAVFAGISTWRLARRRARASRFLGRQVQPVSLRTYVYYLAGWFFGFVAVFPLLILGLAVAVIILTAIAIVVIILVVAALLGAS